MCALVTVVQSCALPIYWFTVECFAKVSSVNLGGVVFGVIAALKSPSLKQVIITASGAAILPLEMDPYYTMTKFGVLGLGLALEPTLNARGVRLDIKPGPAPGRARVSQNV